MHISDSIPYRWFSLHQLDYHFDVYQPVCLRWRSLVLRFLQQLNLNEIKYKIQIESINQQSASLPFFAQFTDDTLRSLVKFRFLKISLRSEYIIILNQSRITIIQVQPADLFIFFFFKNTVQNTCRFGRLTTFPPTDGLVFEKKISRKIMIKIVQNFIKVTLIKFWKLLSSHIWACG